VDASAWLTDTSQGEHIATGGDCGRGSYKFRAARFVWRQLKFRSIPRGAGVKAPNFLTKGPAYLGVDQSNETDLSDLHNMTNQNVMPTRELFRCGFNMPITRESTISTIFIIMLFHLRKIGVFASVLSRSPNWEET
jgi:hypothetical protein